MKKIGITSASKRKFPYDDCTSPESKKINMVVSENVATEPSPRSYSLIPVLSTEFERKMETELMYVAKITEKTEISRLIKELSQTWPLVGKHYLKRVRSTPQKGIFDIILHPVSDTAIEDQHSEVESLEHAIGNAKINTKGLSSEVTKCSVPKYPPLTREQYEESMKFWPVQFHEDKYIAKILSDQLFSNDDKDNMEKWMNSAIEVAKYGELQVGAVIVNPADNEVIAVAHDQRHLHPLQHAVMVAIDLVARSQGGGSWDIKSQHVSYASDVKKYMIATNKSSLPYLCTSYDLYVTREPCIMCAMALVHSRISRVFIGTSTPWGALGNHYKLHVHPGLNHHYEVWKGLMEKECQQLGTQDIQTTQCNLSIS